MKIASRGVHESVQHEYGTLLYDLSRDYAQEHPLDDGAEARRMAAALAREMEALDAPAEQYVRLGLPVPPGAH
jgi:hypothetical protein